MYKAFLPPPPQRFLVFVKIFGVCEPFCIFSGQFVYFLLFLTCLTFALVLAAEKIDPRLYDTPFDVFRGICEGFTLLSVLYNGFSEINQMRM